jgi:hypothetical protein
VDDPDAERGCDVLWKTGLRSSVAGFSRDRPGIGPENAKQASAELAAGLLV